MNCQTKLTFSKLTFLNFNKIQQIQRRIKSIGKVNIFDFFAFISLVIINYHHTLYKQCVFEDNHYTHIKSFDYHIEMADSLQSNQINRNSLSLFEQILQRQQRETQENKRKNAMKRSQRYYESHPRNKTTIKSNKMETIEENKQSNKELSPPKTRKKTTKTKKTYDKEILEERKRRLSNDDTTDKEKQHTPKRKIGSSNVVKRKTTTMNPLSFENVECINSVVHPNKEMDIRQGETSRLNEIEIIQIVQTSDGNNEE